MSNPTLGDRASNFHVPVLRWKSCGKLTCSFKRQTACSPETKIDLTWEDMPLVWNLCASAQATLLGFPSYQAFGANETSSEDIPSRVYPIIHHTLVMVTILVHPPSRLVFGFWACLWLLFFSQRPVGLDLGTKLLAAFRDNSQYPAVLTDSWRYPKSSQSEKIPKNTVLNGFVKKSPANF